jgi:hypothetical protein
MLPPWTPHLASHRKRHDSGERYTFIHDWRNTGEAAEVVSVRRASGVRRLRILPENE